MVIGSSNCLYHGVSIVVFTDRFFETSDRQNLLTEVAGFVSDATAIVLMMTKSSYETIRFLKIDRRIIATSLNELRANIFNLQQKHSYLAEDYINFRNQFDTSTVMTHRFNELDLPTEVTRWVDQRHNTNQRLEQMIGNIRRLSDFEQFLLSPIEDEFKVAATSRSIVVINVSDYRCDALIVEKREL